MLRDVGRLRTMMGEVGVSDRAAADMVAALGKDSKESK